MNFTEFSSAVSEIDFGKNLPGAVYLHRDHLNRIPSKLRALIDVIILKLKVDSGSWNILKLYKRDFKFSLLHYPAFEKYPYPPLQKSFTIDLVRLTLREADYSDAENPPILHRRETFLHQSDPRIEEYLKYTIEGQDLGLYADTTKIGSRKGWERVIRSTGYQLESNGKLKKLELSESLVESEPQKIQRHKTAISRNSLSVPMFLLAQKGFLDGTYSILDYGCGRGDDIRELEAHGISVIGWDPVYCPDTDLKKCDIVNLGFVINVIEDKEERAACLRKAYSFADKLLLVSAMLGNESVYQKFKPYKDGVVTSKNTFQKYFFQSELKSYIELTLNESAIAISPGVFAVFRDKLEEQKYLLERQRTRIGWRQLSVKPQIKIEKKAAKDIYEKNSSLFDEYWDTTLDLGRPPANSEFENVELLNRIGCSNRKAFNICLSHHGESIFKTSQERRKNDLTTYFALEYFTKRKPYQRMPESLKKDIKYFFSSYSDAKKIASEALFSVSEPEIIDKACELASTLIPSYLTQGHSLVFHRNFLNQLPKELRIYVGCAAQLYGELETIDLIKVHIRSGKVTFLGYKGFDSQAIPLLEERIKVKLREQDIDFFDYVGEYKPQPLYNKSIFMDDTFEGFEKQSKFDNKLSRLGIDIVGDRGPSSMELEVQLSKLGYAIRGNRLVKK